MILYQNRLSEPSAEIKEAAMGLPVGSTAAPTVSVSLRHTVLGGIFDYNISAWLFQSLQAHAQSTPSQLLPAQAYLTDAQVFPARDSWIIDSGATSHITAVRTDFHLQNDYIGPYSRSDAACNWGRVHPYDLTVFKWRPSHRRSS